MKYISLMRLTKAGLAELGDSAKRREVSEARVAALGGRSLAFYAVMGPYDFVQVFEMPSNEAMMQYVHDRPARRLCRPSHPAGLRHRPMGPHHRKRLAGSPRRPLVSRASVDPSPVPGASIAPRIAQPADNRQGRPDVHSLRRGLYAFIARPMGAGRRQAPLRIQTHRHPEGREPTPEFLAINPAGLVPVLITPEGEPLHEVAALMIYLADRHGLTDLAPAPADPSGGFSFPRSSTSPATSSPK